MDRKVGMVSLGCPKNQVDAEVMLGLLQGSGFQLVHEPTEAEILIVNTCGFIESAKEESIQTVLEMAQHKKDNCRLLVVTGCMAERYRDMILQEIPEVDAVVGTGSYGDILRVIAQAEKGERQELYGKLEEVGYLDGPRVLSGNKGVAYLKVAEGCNNRCTYCIIPSLRGGYRSRKLEVLVEEARSLAAQGVRELILVAQDTTRYGTDLYGERKLVSLIRQISGIEGIKWIRLLYCYPEEIDEALMTEIADNPKVCRYLDIPMQHASNRILKAMGRRGTREENVALMSALRRKIPGIVVRTSIIVGFPGESEDDFAELASFVEEMRFDKLGVFAYSKEEDTPAARMKNQIPKHVKKQRHTRIMELQQEISRRLNAEKLGNCYEAIVEGISEDGIFYTGRTYGEAPDIDGFVYFTSPAPLNAGDMVNIHILNTEEYDIIGEVTDESAQ